MHELNGRRKGGVGRLIESVLKDLLAKDLLPRDVRSSLGQFREAPDLSLSVPKI